jgi:hypothetical protein
MKRRLVNPVRRIDSFESKLLDSYTLGVDTPRTRSSEHKPSLTSDSVIEVSSPDGSIDNPKPSRGSDGCLNVASSSRSQEARGR